MVEGASLEYWLLVGLVATVTVGGFWGSFVYLYRSRLIVDMPTARIRSAHQGYIELEGFAEPLGDEPLTAPLTQTPCVWYRYTVEERSTNGQHRTWVTRQSGESDHLFTVNDRTGHCVIDPEGASVIVARRLVWYANDYRDATSLPQPNRLAGWFGLARFRYTEERLHPGEPLYAIGRFRSVGGGEDLPDARSAVRELLVRWKRDRAVLLQRFDADRNGAIDPHEWEQARSAAEREVATEHRARQAEPGHHLLDQPEDGRPFVLSAIPQHKLVSRYRGLALLCFVVSLVSGVAVLKLLALA